MPDEARETWYLPSPDGEGTLVFNGHPAGWCRGAGCPLHGPSPHWARDLPLVWEFDSKAGGRMLRRCKHGMLHEDPDDQAFRRSQGRYTTRWQPCGCGCECVCDWEPPF